MNGIYFPPKGLQFKKQKYQENVIYIPTTFPCNGRLRPIITDIICLPQPKHNEERDGGVFCFQRKEKVCL